MALFPLIPLVVGAGAYAAKKLYDTQTKKRLASARLEREIQLEYEAELEREARRHEEEQRREQREQRQQEHNSRMVAGELQQIQSDYLEAGPLPTQFDASALNTLLESDIDDVASAEKALSELCGCPMSMRPREASREQALRQEMQALKQLEQFIREV